MQKTDQVVQWLRKLLMYNYPQIIHQIEEQTGCNAGKVIQYIHNINLILKPSYLLLILKDMSKM